MKASEVAIEALEAAIAHAGGVSKLAAAIGGSPSAISNWLERKTVINAKRCVAIERATAGAVTRRDLRPDDWAEIWPELADLPASAAPVAIKNAEVANA